MDAVVVIWDFRLEWYQLILIYKWPWYFLQSLVNWLLGYGEEFRNRFSRWQPWQSYAAWISDQNNFTYFWSTIHPDASYQVLSQLDLQYKIKKLKTDFQYGGFGNNLGFSNQNNFRYFKFDLKSSRYYLSSFASIGLSVGEEVQNISSRLWLKWPSLICDGNNLSFFKSTSQSFNSGEEVQNRFSRWWLWWPSWISDHMIKAISDLQVTQILPTMFQVNWPLGSG